MIHNNVKILRLKIILWLWAMGFLPVILMGAYHCKLTNTKLNTLTLTLTLTLLTLTLTLTVLTLTLTALQY